MRIKKSYSNAIIFIGLSLFCQLVILLINQPSVQGSVYSLFIATFTIFAISFITQKLTSPANLLVYSSFVFLGCRPFLTLFGGYDYRIADWFLEGYLDENVTYANYAITLMYYGYAVALIISNNRLQVVPDTTLDYRYNIKLKSLRLLYCLGVLGMILKGLYFYSYIQSNSYVGIYQGGIQVPPGYDLLAYLFYCSFFLICAFYKKYRVNLAFLFISIVVAAFSAMKGSRSEFITFFLTVVAIYFNEKKTNNFVLLVKLSFILIIVFALSEFVSMWRSGGSFVELIEGNNPLVNFIYGMGVSYLSLYQSVKLSMIDTSSTVIFLFAQMIITVSTILKLPLDYTSISYGHLASLTADPELYSKGFGLGGSYLAESYLAFGLFGCFIIPCIFLYVLSSLEKRTQNNPIFYFNYYGVLPPILFIPRETLLYFLPYLIKGVFVTLIVMLFSSYKKRIEAE